ncbi:MAG: PIN domain-containing protein [Candidatus Diapherotrites archaeon]|uniref:PIN domain-containing protein n=1 Tax=Candidatus Iainarchaeum sp. TaxID=3101447 RepID=A0A938YUJ5_9ARCH|nr:PIN domain-containing protein [Candidatus Diapherotrites archaeon]
MYAETDFLLALVKEKDWLKKNAEKIYEKHKKEIWTSSLTLIELLFYSNREKIKAEQLLKAAHFLIKVKDTNLTEGDLVTAADLMDKFKATPFDALHAIVSMGEEIISSDSIYDKMGLKRIKLEAFQ